MAGIALAKSMLLFKYCNTRHTQHTLKQVTVLKCLGKVLLLLVLGIVPIKLAVFDFSVVTGMLQKIQIFPPMLF